MNTQNTDQINFVEKMPIKIEAALTELLSTSSEHIFIPIRSSLSGQFLDAPIRNTACKNYSTCYFNLDEMVAYLKQQNFPVEFKCPSCQKSINSSKFFYDFSANHYICTLRQSRGSNFEYGTGIKIFKNGYYELSFEIQPNQGAGSASQSLIDRLIYDIILIFKQITTEKKAEIDKGCKSN